MKEEMAAMHTNAHPEPTQWRKRPLADRATCLSSVAADAALEFGRFRVLLRRRRLLADGIPVVLGTRAFDLLLVLLEADGALLTKEELFRRVWPDLAVSEGSLKVQISALRKALAADRNLIQTEFGRGYRFIGILPSNATAHACRRTRRAKPPQIGDICSAGQGDPWMPPNKPPSGEWTIPIWRIIGGLRCNSLPPLPEPSRCAIRHADPPAPQAARVR